MFLKYCTGHVTNNVPVGDSSGRPGKAVAIIRIHTSLAFSMSRSLETNSLAAGPLAHSSWRGWRMIERFEWQRTNEGGPGFQFFRLSNGHDCSCHTLLNLPKKATFADKEVDPLNGKLPADAVRRSFGFSPLIL